MTTHSTKGNKMNKLQSHEFQELDLNMEIEEVIAVRMTEEGTYSLIAMTNDQQYLNVLVTQKNKVRHFKTLNAVDSFLLGININEFTKMSEYKFRREHVEGS